MEPCDVAVSRAQRAELRLLADPKNPKRQKRHDAGQNTRREAQQSVPEFALVVHRGGIGHAQVEHEQRHRKCEDTVA